MGTIVPNNYFDNAAYCSVKINEQVAEFGSHLRMLREGKALSQQDLAYEADIDIKTIQRIEKGKLNPSLIILISLAKGLKIKLKDLLDYDSKLSL